MSAVALQDWIEVIDGPLRDISDSSSWWWDSVKQRAQESYKKWVASGPYERLSLKPPTAEDLEKGKYSRLSARTAGMMLQAMSGVVRAEMVARAITRSPVALLFRLFTMYQPGGESEKAYILQYLVSPPKAQTATELVTVLRQWERLLLRADNLHIAKPDPSLLVRGLNGLVAEIWAKDKDVMFRTQLVKSKLGVDVSPSWETALQLHQHLRAESENLVNGLPTTTRSGTAEPTRDPKLRPLQPSGSVPAKPPPTTTNTTTSTTSTGSAGASGVEKKCKWFTEPGGCRRGAACKFVHSFEGVSKKNRCYTCGAEGHMATACPTKTDGGDVGNPKAKIKPKAKSTPGTPSSKDEGAKNAPAARSLTTEPEPQPSPPTSPSTAENTGGEVKDALRDAAQALKSLMSSGSSTSSSSTPTLEGLQRQLDELRLKAMRMNKEGAELKKSQATPLDARVLGELPVPPTLIDSGATHILRHPRDKAELSAASKVSVTLANDERRDLLQTESGAILSTSPDTQPILPMAELVSAGCEISWKRGVFKVVHPVWGELKTSLRGGCPELAQEQAAKLVNMIEEKKLKEFKDGVSLLKSKLEHLVQEERLPWTTYATRYVEGGSARDLWKAVHGSFIKGFSEATLDLLCPEVCVGDGWKTLKALPLPRRLRKRMMESHRWVIHLPVHRDDTPLKPEAYGKDAVVVSVHGDLLPQAYEALMWGAVTGRIAAITGATPGASVTKEVQTVRLARAILLYIVGRLARPTARTGFFWTVPNGEKKGEVFELLQEDRKVASMEEVEFDQGAWGLATRRSSLATTNYDLECLGGLNRAEEGTENFIPAEWPPALKNVLAATIKAERFKFQVVKDSGTLRAMSQEQWQAHVRAGHYPARRDCLQCVTHGATGHRHARVEHPSLFCLNVDISGPFKTTGEDPGARGDRSKAARMKYLLVAKFTIPKSYVTGEFEPTGENPQQDGEIGHEDLFDEEKVVGAPLPLVPSDCEEYEPSVVNGEDDEGDDNGAGVGAIPMDVKAPESTYLLFAEPLLNDKGPTVASAIQSIILYLQSLNVPVLRFHSDRAAQLMSRSLTQWLHGQAVRTSTSTPGVPQENGGAECAVKEVKLTTRKILSTSTLDKTFWPVAAKAAASMQRARILRQVPRMATAFGAKVLVKRRRYAASGALIRLEFDERWTDGVYLGLSDQVHDGHLVYVDGIFTHTKNVKDKAKLVDAGDHRDELGKGPEGLLGFEPEGGSSPMARRRIVGKSAPRVAALEGQREVYDDDLIVDLGETSDLEEEAEQLEVCLDVLSPRVACLGTSSRVGEVEQRGGQDNEMNPEDYAKEILYEEEDVDEEMIKRLFELLPSQQFARESTETSEGEMHPKAWASGAYRHGGVLGIRNSSKEFPYATRVVNQFIRTHLGEDATWSTFSIHRNLSVKRHRDSHNARDKYSRLIPITDFKEGGLWTQLAGNEEVNEDEVVMLDGKRGRVHPLRSEEGSMNVVSFDSRQWHATMPWKGERLVVAVYTVRGLEKMSQDDADLALDLGFPLPQNAAVGDEPKIRKLLEGEGGNQTETDLELETSESIMYIRMSEEEWVTTSQTHGLNHYIPAMATGWRTIQPADEDLNSVTPAAIVADLERDWGQFPRIFLVSDAFQELQLGTLLALRSYRVPNYDPEGRNASFIKAFKIRNDVLNIEEVIVLWVHRSVTVRRVPREEQPRGAGDGPAPDQGGGDESRIQDPDPRRGLPELRP